MVRIGRVVTDRIASLLSADGGLRHALRLLGDTEDRDLPRLEQVQSFTSNVSPEILDRTAGSKYPQVTVFCDKIVNSLRERFRTFSGTAQAVIEIRVSHDRIEQLDSQLGVYVDSVIYVLQGRRGDWGDGLHYGGQFEVVFSSTKLGGKHFTKTARVQFPVDVSIE